MTNTIALERHDSGFRAIIFEETKTGFFVQDIIETDDLGQLNAHVDFNFPNIYGVRRVGEDIIVPDCLSVFETAEAVMADLRD